MAQKDISKILVAIIALVIIAGLSFYWLNRTTDDQADKSVPTALPPTTAIVSVTVSPISPLSPVNSVTDAANGSNSVQVEILLNNGIALYEKQDYQGAIKVFDDVLRKDPKSALAYNARGSVYLDLKDYDKAAVDYTKATELEPTFPHAFYNRGRAYTFLKKYDVAIADLQYSIQLSPTEFGYRANGNIGLIYHQQGQYDKALEAFAKAISYDDTKADTYYLRGETYTAMEDYEAAIKDYQAAISRFPNYSQAYQGLGYAYYKTDQFDQAREALLKAVELSPNSPVPHFYLMLVYVTTGQLDQTKAEVSQAMDQIDTLSEEEQNLLFKRVLTDLEAFVKKNPDKAQDVEALIKVIPEPQGP